MSALGYIAGELKALGLTVVIDGDDLTATADNYEFAVNHCLGYYSTMVLSGYGYANTWANEEELTTYRNPKAVVTQVKRAIQSHTKWQEYLDSLPVG